MAHTTEVYTWPVPAKVPKPQSVPAMTRSHPTASAKRPMRWAALGLPDLDLKAPWHGYPLSAWTDENAAGGNASSGGTVRRRAQGDQREQDQSRDEEERADRGSRFGFRHAGIDEENARVHYDDADCRDPEL